MIDRREILEVASMRRLRPDVIEKDYVLGWVLAGIFAHPDLASTWAFKGGTCLKKCHSETHRFSEDLDFTVEEQGQMDAGFLRKVFKEVSEWIYDQTGIQVPADQPRFDIYRNRGGGLNIEGRIYYRGPLQPRGSLPRVKLDLTADERLVHRPVWRPITHQYADRPEDGMFARCYVFQEVFGEKVRALGERCRPRDLYDVVNLFWNDSLRPEASAVHQVVQEKCNFKGIPVPDMAALQRFEDELTGDWDAMLGHQLLALPPLEAFWDAVPEFFQWLLGCFTPTALSGIPVGDGEEIMGGETKPYHLGTRDSAALEVIRFAAATRLCIDLTYAGSVHRVEPYSLRRTASGTPVLYACPVGHGEYRSYPVGSVDGANCTDEPFEPRYANELSPKHEPSAG